MPSHRETHFFALSWHWRKDIKKLIQSRAGDAARRRVHVDATSSSRQGDCPLCKSFGDFRKAIRRGSIDAATAKRIFNKHFVRLRDICKRENCSMEMARTINAVLECDIDYAFRREGKPGFLKAYDTVETLLEDLKS